MARTRGITNEEILDVVRKLLIDNGLSVTTKRMAAAVGVSEGVLFQRFRTKRRLIEAALSGPDVDPAAVVDAAAGHADPARAFEDVAAAVFALFRRLAPATLPVLRRTATVGPRLGLTDGLFMQVKGAVERHLEAERAAGRLTCESTQAVALLLVSSLHHAALFEAVSGPTPHVSELAAREAARALWLGLRR